MLFQLSGNQTSTCALRDHELKYNSDLIFNEQAVGQDLVIGMPIRFGTGFGLPSQGTIVDWMPKGKICFWSGWGGSIVIMDTTRRLTIAYGK